MFGSGAIIYKNPTLDDQNECIEASFYTGYKISEGAIASQQGTKRAVFSNLILIDNTLGTSLNVGQEGEELWAEVKDSIFYGESDIPDCDV